MSRSFVSAKYLEKEGYVMGKLLGKGHFGEVFTLKKDDEEMLVKIVNLEGLSDNDERKLAAQEVDLLRKLDHPNVVRLYDSYIFGFSFLNIIMEICHGGDLTKLIKEKKAQEKIEKTKKYIPEKIIILWLYELSSALKYIHEQKILHRDVKASNVFMVSTYDEIDIPSVKLGDFGISRVLDFTAANAETVVGTPYYMAPEICKSEAYSYPTDIWSLGCTFYEICTFNKAFSSKSLVGLVYKIVSETHEAIKDYSEELVQLISLLLRKAKEERPSAASILTSSIFNPNSNSNSTRKKFSLGQTAVTSRLGKII